MIEHAARGRAAAPFQVLLTGMLVGAAAILLVGLFAAAGSDRLGHDFRVAYLPAAEAVRDGQSPYPDPDSAIVREERAYVYPPQVALLLAPLTFIPVDLAAFLAFAACLAALVGTLALLGIRDIRCYAALLLWAPAWNALEMANVSALLALALALVWRHRSSTWRSGAVLGVAASAKFFLWPLFIWTLATRRWRAGVVAAVVAVTITLGAWAAIGFGGVRDYPELLRELSAAEAARSYSFVGIADAFGVSQVFGRTAMVVLGVVLLLACIHLGRRGDDRRAFTCSVVAALVLTPILWQHYLMLLAVPLALARPRFSAAWLMPILLWVSPRAGNGDMLQTLVPAVVVTVLIALLVVRPPRQTELEAAVP